MPRIPTYNQQTTPQAALGANLDTGGQSVARGLGSLAQGVQRLTQAGAAREEVLRRKDEADAVSAINLDLAKGEVQWDDWLASTMESRADSPSGVTGEAATEFDKWAGELRSKANTPRSRQMAELGIVQMRGRLLRKSMEWEASRGVEIRAGKYAESVDFQQKVVRADAGQYDRILETSAAALNDASLPAAARDKAWLATKQNLSTAAVEGMIQRNPYQALKDLNAEPGKSKARAINDLTFDDLERARAAAQAEIDRREAKARAAAAEARQGLSDAEADAFAAKATGIPAQLPSRAAYMAAYGVEEGAKRYGLKSQLFGAFDVVSSAILLPPAEGAAKVAAYRPTQQAGAADQSQIAQAAASMYAEQRRAFEADPAGTLVARDPELASAFEAAASPGATTEQVQNYVRRVVSVQQAAGIASRRILPKNVADQYSAALAFDPKKPQQRTQTLQALQAQWGKAFPAILAQIAPKMDGTARVLVGMKPENGARLDAALASGKEMLSKSLPKTDKTQIDDQIRANLQPFAATIADATNFEQIYGEHFEAAQTLAYSLAARGESPKRAAQFAADAVVNDQYTYSGTIRVPASQPADAVLAGADAARLAAVGDQKLAIRSSTWSDDATAQAELKAAIGRGGYWVTNEEGSGLVLMVPTNRGATAVYKADGARVEYTWPELVKLSTTRPRVPGEINPQSPTYRDPLATGNRP